MKYKYECCRLENVYTKNVITNFYESTFSDRTLQHAMLYIPEGTWGEAVYDGGWYVFNNIKEVSTKVASLSPKCAYTLMNMQNFGYTVYDAETGGTKNVKAFYSLDDEDPNSCWATRGEWFRSFPL